MEGGYELLFIDDFAPAPLDSMLDVSGERTHDVIDPVVGMKVRIAEESPVFPAWSFRVATRLPAAGNESGLGLDTTDFFLALLAAKDAAGLRWVANLGLGILEVPTAVTSQNDVLTYGFSVSREIGSRIAVAAGVDGHVDVSGQVHPGTEDTSVARLGGSFGAGASTLDAALLIGLAEVDAPIGITVGITRAFRLFDGR